MKNILLLTLTVLSNALFAGSEDAVINLTSKVIIDDHVGFYSLSDGTTWKVFSFSPRWRSLSEWWQGVELVLESYLTEPDDWYVGADVEILAKNQNMQAKDDDSSISNSISRCTHIIHNVATDKCLFAVELRPECVLVELYNDTYKIAYDRGFTKGRLKNDAEASKQFEKGYQAGYQQGKRDEKNKNSNR